MAMKDISEKTGISLGLLLTLLAMLAGAGATAVVAVYRVGALEEGAKEQKQKDREQDNELASLKLGAVANAEAFKNLQTLVSRMDVKLDRLLDNNRTSNANYRTPRSPVP